MVKGKIIAPTFPTCKGRVVDYFVVSADLAGAVMGVTAIDDAGCKPHRPVRLYLNAKPRAMSGRMMNGVGDVADCATTRAAEEVGVRRR